MNKYHGIYLPYLSGEDVKHANKVCMWLNEHGFIYELTYSYCYIKFGIIIANKDEEKVINAIMEIYNK